MEMTTFYLLSFQRYSSLISNGKEFWKFDSFLESLVILKI